MHVSILALSRAATTDSPDRCQRHSKLSQACTTKQRPNPTSSPTRKIRSCSSPGPADRHLRRSTSAHKKANSVACTSYLPRLSMSSSTSLISRYFEVQHLPMRASIPAVCSTSMGYCPARYLSWISSWCSPSSGKTVFPCQR